MDSLLVTRHGVHRFELHPDGGDLSEEALAQVTERMESFPTYQIESLRW